MSYHQIVITTREERPLTDNHVHDLIWLLYDNARRFASGYPTIRVLDVKGNIIDEANRRLHESGMRDQYPSDRTSTFVVSDDQPEPQSPDQVIAQNRVQIYEHFLALGYPHDAGRVEPSGISVACHGDSGGRRLMNDFIVNQLPPYSSLPTCSDYEQHECGCNCGECITFQVFEASPWAFQALCYLACSRDDWDLSVDNINTYWWNAISDIYETITGERP